MTTHARLRAIAIPAAIMITTGFSLTACGGSGSSSDSSTASSSAATEPACSQEALNAAAAAATGLPCTDPLRFGCANLADALETL